MEKLACSAQEHGFKVVVSLVRGNGNTVTGYGVAGRGRRASGYNDGLSLCPEAAYTDVDTLRCLST